MQQATSSVSLLTTPQASRAVTKQEDIGFAPATNEVNAVARSHSSAHDRSNAAGSSTSSATALWQGALPVPNTQEATQGRSTVQKKRILSLDGGGIRGISTLLILQDIMECLRELCGHPETLRPCEFFDLIGGTNTGGQENTLGVLEYKYMRLTSAGSLQSCLAR